MVFYQVSLKRKDSSSNFSGSLPSEDYEGGSVFWSSRRDILGGKNSRMFVLWRLASY